MAPVAPGEPATAGSPPGRVLPGSFARWRCRFLPPCLAVQARARRSSRTSDRRLPPGPAGEPPPRRAGPAAAFATARAPRGPRASMRLPCTARAIQRRPRTWPPNPSALARHQDRSHRPGRRVHGQPAATGRNAPEGAAAKPLVTQTALHRPRRRTARAVRTEPPGRRRAVKGKSAATPRSGKGRPAPGPPAGERGCWVYCAPPWPAAAAGWLRGKSLPARTVMSSRARCPARRSASLTMAAATRRGSSSSRPAR